MVFNERKNSSILSDCFNDNKMMFSSDSFEDYLKGIIHSVGGYLPLVDMYFILKKVIDYYFKDDFKNQKIYKNIYYKLFELYKTLSFYNLKHISSDKLNHIKKSYPEYCVHIFSIYNEFIDIIEKINKDVNLQNSNKINYSIPKLQILLSINKSENMFDTFIGVQKREIEKIISSVDQIYLDGFISFNDMDKYIISVAEKLGKEIIFVTKNIKEDFNQEFLKNVVYNCNNAEFINLNESDSHIPDDIKYLRYNFYEPKKFDPNLPETDRCNNINFVSPFLNKNDEIQYITEKIGEIIKENCINEDSKGIREFVFNNILIVCAVDKNKMCKYIDSQFTRTGIFFFKGTVPTIFEKEIDASSFSRIYYNLNQFISEEVIFKDGSKLTSNQKLDMFGECFSRIYVSTVPQNLLDFPILDFIFQIYSISSEGIDVNKFKSILFSNWYYYVGKSDVKWDEFLGAFNQIQNYFVSSETLDSWIMKIKDIMDCRKNILNDPLYKFHPFTYVSEHELNGLLKIMEEINSLSKILSQMNGSIDSHIALLRDKFIAAGKISDNSVEDLNEVQILVKKFFDLVNNFLSNSTVQSFDSTFFFKHLQNIASSCKIDKQVDSMKNSSRLIRK